MDLFWSKVMPACVANYPWGSQFLPEMSASQWEDGLKTKIKAMDDSEFDLFLASVVMTSAKEQMMGAGLTEKINFFRGLRV